MGCAKLACARPVANEPPACSSWLPELSIAISPTTPPAIATHASTLATVRRSREETWIAQIRITVHWKTTLATGSVSCA